MKFEWMSIERAVGDENFVDFYWWHVDYDIFVDFG